jgi:hypothetical protein
MQATIRTRYSFTAQRIAGAVLMQRRAADIEAMSAPDGLARAEHRALVVAAVKESAAALGDELDEILQHGPGHHLGSNGTNAEALAILSPVADLISRSQGVLEKYAIVLALLRKPALPKGERTYQDTVLLVGLRNELEHYRSNWDGDTKRASLLPALQAKHFAPPPFVSTSANFFPHQVLGAACARWAPEASAAFIDHVYEVLGVRSVLDGHRVLGADFVDIMPARRKSS